MRSPSDWRCWRPTRSYDTAWARPACAQMLQRYAVSRLVDDVDRLYRTLLATASDTTRR